MRSPMEICCILPDLRLRLSSLPEVEAQTQDPHLNKKQPSGLQHTAAGGLSRIFGSEGGGRHKSGLKNLSLFFSGSQFRKSLSFLERLG